MLAHVDRSGYVCRVTLVNGSGIGEVDHAVLNAVRFWRLAPAQSGGEPVESLFRGGVEFRMTHVLTGELFAGYTQRTYDDAAFEEVANLIVR